MFGDRVWGGVAAGRSEKVCIVHNKNAPLLNFLFLHCLSPYK